MTAPVARVRILGAESTGKTTLAADLAAAYQTVWNPEFGRPYTELGREPGTAWTSAEFTHIARLQCWYEDALAEQATGVLVCDTDALTTAVFHEVYLGHPTHAFDNLLERRYELTLVCALDVPWRHDGVREFEAQRLAMHERYVAEAQASGRPWLLVEGTREVRLATARAALDEVLAAGVNVGG